MDAKQLAEAVGCSLELAAECVAKRPDARPEKLVAFAQLKLGNEKLKLERLAREASASKPHCHDPLHAAPQHRRSDGKCFLCERAKVWASKNEE